MIRGQRTSDHWRVGWCGEALSRRRPHATDRDDMGKQLRNIGWFRNAKGRGCDRRISDANAHITTGSPKHRFIGAVIAQADTGIEWARLSINIVQSRSLIPRDPRPDLQHVAAGAYSQLRTERPKRSPRGEEKRLAICGLDLSKVESGRQTLVFYPGCRPRSRRGFQSFDGLRNHRPEASRAFVFEMEPAACDFEAMIAGENEVRGETPPDVVQGAPADDGEGHTRTGKRLLHRLPHGRNQFRVRRTVDERTECAVKIRRNEDATRPVQDRIDFSEQR